MAEQMTGLEAGERFVTIASNGRAVIWRVMEDGLVLEDFGQGDPRSVYFQQGWRALSDEFQRQREDPEHPITDTNPYRRKDPR